MVPPSRFLKPVAAVALGLALSMGAWADLKGKKVAAVWMATGDAVLRGALTDAKVDWKSDVQIFELKNPPAVIEAVKSGQVDAGLVWGPRALALNSPVLLMNEPFGALIGMVTFLSLSLLEWIRKRALFWQK